MGSSEPECAIKGRSIDQRKQSGVCVIFFSMELSKYNQNPDFWNSPPRILSSVENTNIPLESVHNKKKSLIAISGGFFFPSNESNKNCISVLCYKIMTLFSA